MNFKSSDIIYISCVTFLLTFAPSKALFAKEAVKIKGENVSYLKGKKTVQGFLAQPVKEGKYPAIVLIHEWWGLNDYIRDNARKFAELGYVVLAVDLYDGKSTTKREEAGKLARSVRSDQAAALAHLKEAVEFLKSQPNTDADRIASCGWCFGGGWSYQMAKNDLGVKATVIYYGHFNPTDDLKKMRAEIIGHFGEKDTGIKLDTVKAFQANLKTLKGNHEIFIYENAGHGFSNPTNPKYNKDASEKSWKRTIEFLDKHL